jgi:hypothetical protein
LGVREQRRLNTTGLDEHLSENSVHTCSCGVFSARLWTPPFTSTVQQPHISQSRFGHSAPRPRSVFWTSAVGGGGREDGDESKQGRKASACLLMSSLTLQQVNACIGVKPSALWLILANCVRCICHGVEAVSTDRYPLVSNSVSGCCIRLCGL